MKTAMVTGITGQDGAYLSKLLLTKKYNVIGLLRENRELGLKNLQYIKILEKNNVNEIYNLAAQSSVALSFSYPIETIEFNIISTVKLLEAVRSVNPKIKFYQASSSEMFGNVDKDKLPINKNIDFRPISPYGISKATSHWITVNYREAYNIFAVELRLGNLNVYRDWGYAPKYVEAMWLMLQQNVPKDYVISSGETHSLKEFVIKVFEKLDLDVKKFLKIDRDLYRPIDIQKNYGDNSEAKNKLKWNYNINFEQLINKLIEDEIQYINWELENRKYWNVERKALNIYYNTFV